MNATEPRTDDTRPDLRPEVEVRSVPNPRRVRWTTRHDV